MSQNTVSRYQVIDEIGRGGMATVYRAFDPMFKRDVAVKVMAGEHLMDKTLRARFEREAQTIAALEHPAIVPVYDFGEDNGRLYLVMRIMTGGTLTDRLRRGSLSINDTSQILQRIGGALERAHDKGIIHRDLKPSNILFDSYGDAFLADFGIARLTESTVTLTGQAVVGTPAYMSPEQIHGDMKIDGRSDIYALGVICFEMLTGQRPYQDATPAKVMMKHIIDPVPDIREVNHNLPEGVAVVIARTMAKAPDDRFSKATEMTDTLDAIARPGTPVLVPTTQPSPDAPILHDQPKTPAPPPVLPADPDAPTMLADETVIPELVPSTEVSPPDIKPVPEPAVPYTSSPAELAPETEVARPEFPTKPAQETRRSLTIPLIIAGMAAIFVVAIFGIILAATGVFAPGEDESTATPEPEQVASGLGTDIDEPTVAPDEAEPTRPPAPTVEFTLSDSIQLMKEASDLFEEGALDAALVRASRAIELAPEFAEHYFQRSEMYFQVEDFGPALDDLNRAIELEPTAKYYLQRGVLHRRNGDQDQAIADFQQAIELDPDNPEPFIDLAIVFRQIDDFGAALEMSNMAVEIDPYNSRALNVRSRALKQLGDTQAALADGLRSYWLDPDNWRVLDNLSDIYAWHLGNPEEGIKYFALAIDLFPDDAWRYADRAILFGDIGDGEAALADLETAIELDPNTAWYYVQKGVTLRDMFDDIEGAMINFEAAMAVDPGDPDPFDERARTYSDYLGDYEAAIVEINRAIELDPGEAWRYQFRAQQLQDMGDIDAALADYLRATELDTAEAWTFIDLGYFYFDVLGEEELAIDAWNIAVEMEPDNPEVYLARYAYFAYVIEDREAAVAELDRCLMRNSEHAWCYWERAWFHNEIGEVEAAKRDFEAFMEYVDEEECPDCVQDAFNYLAEN